MLLGQLEQAEAPLEQAVGLMQKLFAEFPASIKCEQRQFPTLSQPF